jgi:uncharacterized membrane protein YhaH (DUF805 family)
VFIFGYLIVAAIYFAIGLPLMSVIMDVPAPGMHTLNITGVNTIYLMYTLYILSFIANFSLASLVVKRLHDIGLSGFWALGVISANALCAYIVGKIPVNWVLLAVFWTLILFICFLMLLLYPGEQKDNAYGTAHAK